MIEKRAMPDKKLGDDAGHKLTMFDVAGPAVLLMWMATLIQWPFFMFLPWVAWFCCLGDFSFPAFFS